MSLANRAIAPAADTVHGYPCSVGQLRQELPSDELAGLDRMLEDSTRSARQVFDDVTAEGHYVAYTSIGSHRRRQCRCFARARA
jgi:hypothetical protein